MSIPPIFVVPNPWMLSVQGPAMQALDTDVWFNTLARKFKRDEMKGEKYVDSDCEALGGCSGIKQLQRCRTTMPRAKRTVPQNQPTDYKMREKNEYIYGTMR